MPALLIAVLVILVLQSFLVVSLLRSHADILKRLHDLENSADRQTQKNQNFESFLKSVTGVSPDQRTVSVAINSFKQNLLICFLSSGCHTCSVFWKQLSDEALSELKVIPLIVTKGPNREDLEKIKGLYNSKVRCIMSDETWSAFKVPATPFFVLLDTGSGAKIGEGTAVNLDSLKSFVNQSLTDYRADKTAGNVNRSTMKDRQDLVDRALRKAGIFKGHPSLSGKTDDQD